ncbi:monofunctional C1-tetrahydrofolate synthase, mitochondrial-like [Sinocyclocheilus grahami]|uniref:monofunctional C1-tetrahydrofolate synthase, mitochondrial-like n=1 Tax=Sinocyclocheilus grahami TaxID=75366 RepID=UPI0007ACECDD|nr:PREDICTED: monofunctional C1-tetrahydrofolate synthase, mitochondrial-like [Sinocyclocheilus grahami]
MCLMVKCALCVHLIYSDIVQRSREELKAIRETNPGLKPTLAIIQAGEDDGLLEVNKKMAGKIGLNVMQICLPRQCTEEEVIEEILRLNEDSRVYGIFLNLPQSFLSKSVRNAVKPQKDVDGVSDLNVGRVVLGDQRDSFASPIAGAVLEMLARHDAPLIGKMAVLVGVEGPLKATLQFLLQNNGMMVQTCQWSSKHLQKQIMDSDLVILLETDHKGLPPTWLRPGVAVINLSSALMEEHPDSWEHRAEAESGAGVGPLSGALRMQHVVRSSRRWIQEQQYQPWRLRPLKLQPLSPVPSDIEISRAQTPKPISQLAQEVGLLPEELEAYGNTKAKVHLSLLNRLQHQPNGKYVLVAGYAPLIGKMAVLVGVEGPLKATLQFLLQNNGMMVQTCQWSSKHLQKQIMDSDLVILLETDHKGLPPTWLRPGVAVINLSSALMEEHPDSWEHRAEAESGAGVGPLSGALRMQHVVRSSRRWIQEQQYQPWRLRPLKLQPLSPVPSDIEISRAQTPKPISQLAQEVGLLPEELEAYGNTKAKVHLSLLNRLQHQPNGKYVLVAGITPTPLGEGKSTVTIGLVQALSAHLKLNSFACLRQPSQGPTFGVKGGAAGGGYAQVIPMEEFNLHLTGDIHAITAANNLVAAAIDARILHEATQSDKALYSRLVPSVNGVRCFSPIQMARLQHLGINKSDPSDLTPEEVRAFVRLDLDPEKVTWQRVIDTNDRFLRKITVGQANTEKGHARQTQFDIAVASEIMAILALTDGLADMRARLGRMVVGSSRNGQPITADDLDSIVEKIRTIAQKVYGADDIELSPEAQAKIDYYNQQGFGALPICMAKTHLSLSHMPEKKGVPTGFILPIRDIRASIGAGFIYPLVGTMSTMPGLPTRPCFYDIDLDPVTEEIKGLF